MSEFFGSTSFDFNVREFSSNFRPLDLIGYPNYAIDLEGFCINFFTGNMAAIDPNYGSYILRHPFFINAPAVKFPSQYLVKVVWWDTDLDSIIDSPYRAWILQYREFMLLPEKDKKVLPYRNSISGYIATRYGDIWSMRFMTKLTGQLGCTGYRHVTFNKDNACVDVHRVIAETFLPIPQRFLEQGYTKDTLVVNHIDGNKQNNRCDNLEWCICEDNAIHASETNLYFTTIPDVLLEKIWYLLSQKYSDTEISIKTGIGAPTIGNIRHQQSLRYRTDKYDWPGKNLTDKAVIDKYLMLIDAYNKGMHMQEIASKYNTSEATIRRALNAFPDQVVKRKYNAKERNKLLEPKELNKIFDMLEAGYNNADIAKVVLRPISTIRDIRIRKNFAKESADRHWPMNPNVPQVKDPEWIKKVMNLYNQGMSGLAISKKLDGISHDNVLRIIRNNK